MAKNPNTAKKDPPTTRTRQGDFLRRKFPWNPQRILNLFGFPMQKVFERGQGENFFQKVFSLRVPHWRFFLRTFSLRPMVGKEKVG